MTTTTPPQTTPASPKLPANVLTFRSDDGLVQVRVKTSGMRRWPAHNYPCVLLEVRPRSATRVTPLKDGSGGVEVMLRHSEVRGLIEAMNTAAGLELYSAREVKDKPPQRRQRWAAINHSRHADRAVVAVPPRSKPSRIPDSRLGN